jgi:hypothetical protein
MHHCIQPLDLRVQNLLEILSAMILSQILPVTLFTLPLQGNGYHVYESLLYVAHGRKKPNTLRQDSVHKDRYTFDTVTRCSHAR